MHRRAVLRSLNVLATTPSLGAGIAALAVAPAFGTVSELATLAGLCLMVPGIIVIPRLWWFAESWLRTAAHLAVSSVIAVTILVAVIASGAEIMRGSTPSMLALLLVPVVGIATTILLVIMLTGPSNAHAARRAAQLGEPR